MEVQLMITEDYCDFETAKLLKEKGFNEKCFRTYFNDGIISRIFDDKDEIYNENLLPSVVAAPTLQMALKWIREQGFYINIDIDVDYDEDERGTKWYYKPAWDWVVFRIDERKQMSDNGALYATYEQAAEVAIKWCLENLI